MPLQMVDAALLPGLGVIVFAVSALGGQLSAGLVSPSLTCAPPLAGLVVLLAALVGWLVAVARGQNGEPYDWLLGAGGLAYLVSFAFFRWRG